MKSNKKNVYVMAFSALFLFSSVLLGCKQDPSETGRTETTKVVKTTVKDLKKNVKIEVNPNASVLATRSVSSNAAKSITARSAAMVAHNADGSTTTTYDLEETDFTLDESDTLLAITEDGDVEAYIASETTVDDSTEYTVTIETETVIKYDDGTEKTDTKEETKKMTAEEINNLKDEDIADDVVKPEDEVFEEKEVIVLPNVKETYQCSFDKIEEQAKGIYIVYEGYCDAAEMSALSYVIGDDIVDVLKVDGKYKKTPMVHLKSNSDEPYIRFDENGNLYCLAYDDDNNGKLGLWKFNPNSRTTTEATSEDLSSFQIRRFQIDEKGRNAFLNVFEDYDSEKYIGYDAVYVLPLLGSNKTPVKLYKSSSKEYAVGNIVYMNDAIYFVVDDDDYGNGRNYGVDSAIYVAKADKDGNYSAANVVAEKNLTEYIFRCKLESCYDKETKTFDYKAIKDYLFSFCGAAVEKEFRLNTLFQTYASEAGVYDFTYGDVYTTEKDEAALKYLLQEGVNITTKKGDVVNVAYNFLTSYDNQTHQWPEESIKDADGKYVKLYLFICYVWSYERSRIPFESLVFEKGTENTAYTTSKEYYTSDLAAEQIRSCDMVASEDGVYLLFPEWDDQGHNTHSSLWQYVDASGKKVMKTPTSIASVKLAPCNRDNWDWIDPSEDFSKWYKKPFQTSGDGIFMYNNDKTAIWHYRNGTAENLLSFDSSSENISEIVNFSVSEDSVYYTAKSGNTYFTKKVDINTKESKQIAYNDILGQIMEIDGRSVRPDAYDGATKISITVKQYEDLEISQTKTGTKITLKVANADSVDEDGEKFKDFKWECLGNVIETGKTFEIPETWGKGNYPVVLTAVRNGRFYSKQISVTIE